MFEDIFTGGVVSGIDNGEFMNNDLLKAMEAGLMTGMQYADQLNNGGGLKIESLDAVIKVLEFSEKNLAFWKGMPKKKIYNTVHQYNQLVRYGQDVGIFNLEGETPQFTDSEYRRKPIVTKFMGIGGQVTHPATLVRIAAEGQDMYQLEVRNKTLKLLQQIDIALVTANSKVVPTEFSGVLQQHMEGILDIYGGSDNLSSEEILDKYFGDIAVINADGSVLTDAMIQQASNTIVNYRYGNATSIMANPIVFQNYVNEHTANKVLNLAGVSNNLSNRQSGLQITSTATQFGSIDFESDPFFAKKYPRLQGSDKTTDKAPAAPVADSSTPVAAVNPDTKTKFTGHAGSYYYAVAARNRYGLSQLVILNPNAAQAVTETQSVDLKFTAGVGSSYATTGFVIYRTVADAANLATAEFHPIFEIPVNALTTGWDGATAGLVRDRNRFIAGTTVAMVYQNSADILEYLQLADTMKMDFAITSPSRRFAILNYGTPCAYAPGKITMIYNIGTKTA